MSNNSLRSISDQEILSRIHTLVVQERKLTLAVLLHLNEIERRKLHLRHGYSSMFDYCTQGLGYSSSAAYRRIQSARCAARFPGLHAMLERNELNLSIVSQASRILTDSNYAEVIARLGGKSQREAEGILAEYQPSVVLRDRARTVVVRVSAAHAECLLQAEPSSVAFAPATPQLATPDACENSAYCRNGSELPRNESETAAPSTAPANVQKRIMLQFSVHPDFMAKIERVRSIAWHRLPANASFEQVFELALDLFIEREDPNRRSERRKEKAEAHQGAALASESRATTNNERYIPARVRDEIFVRDRGQCTFVGASGKRCGSTRALQLDHVNPVARGGASTADNLRLLCAYHNRAEAERLMGPWRGAQSLGTVPQPG